ncbi:MAG: hypothetical protein HY744_16145 [Deltaproteobacteria bacterium]|nr:hypothetical protein [Deltaproteobacteria bacterium]
MAICHYPPGDPDNPQTIEIPPSALDAHLAHGDYLGPCVAPDGGAGGAAGDVGAGGAGGQAGSGGASSQGGTGPGGAGGQGGESVKDPGCLFGGCPSSSQTCCVTGSVVTGKGMVLWLSQCANLQASVNHCGACKHKCPWGWVCKNGICEFLGLQGAPTMLCFAAGGTPCDSSCCLPGSATPNCCPAPTLCTNLQTDEQNCGVCGTVCAAGRTCGPPGACRDLARDEGNCGTCGNACLSGAACCGGVCTPGAVGCTSSADCGGTEQMCNLATGCCMLFAPGTPGMGQPCKSDADCEALPTDVEHPKCCFGTCYKKLGGVHMCTSCGDDCCKIPTLPGYTAGCCNASSCMSIQDPAACQDGPGAWASCP